jgi:hypothetical protein
MLKDLQEGAMNGWDLVLQVESRGLEFSDPNIFVQFVSTIFLT